MKPLKKQQSVLKQKIIMEARNDGIYNNNTTYY